MTGNAKIVPNLWFADEAEEAVAFYTGIFPGSRVIRTLPYTEAGPGTPGTTMAVEFELFGQRMTAINGGVDFPFTDAISLEVVCEDQAEIDRYWAALTEGGKEVQCGWLKDRYGLSWQVTPRGMEGYFDPARPERAARATRAMLGMVKLDIAALEAAADG